MATLNPANPDNEYAYPKKLTNRQKMWGRTESAIYTGVVCPYLNDNNELEMPVQGSKATLDELRYWREQDFPGYFAIDLLNEAAFAFWTQDSDPNSTDEPESHKDRIMQGLDYAVETGFGLVVFYDDAPELREDPVEGMTPYKFEVFPPYHDGYGVKRWDLDDKKKPETFYIAYGSAQGEEVAVAASRCIVIVWNRTTPDWRGLGVCVGCKDEIRDYWYWRRVLGDRAGSRAKARYVFNKTTGGQWTTPESDSVDDAFEGIPHALVAGCDVSAIGGDLSDNEIMQILDALREAIAAKIGVTIADFRGAEAGQKLSVDSNDTKLNRTLRRRQNWGRRYIEAIYKRMGWKFEGLNPAQETPLEVQDKSVLALVDSMENSTDKDIKQLLKGRILTIYKGVKKEELNEIEPKPTDIAGTGPFGAGNPGAGQFRENGSPADRARDRRDLNRQRQDNEADSR